MRRPPPHLGPTARAHRRSRLVIDLAARIVLVAGEQVQLSAKDYELLVALAEDPERVFKKEDLLRDVWGFAHSVVRIVVTPLDARSRSPYVRSGKEASRELPFRGCCRFRGR